MKLLISVVVPSHNEEKYIGKCLQSLKNQSLEKSKFEIIVVDNASTDKTAKIAKRFNVKVVKEKRLGVGYARQKGLENAKGEIVAFTDADTVLPKHWLKRILQDFSKNSKAVAVFGQNFFVDDEGRRRPHWLFYKFMNSYTKLILRLGKPMIGGANCAAKREALLSVGSFDERYQISEDLMIGQKLIKKGEIIYNPSNIVYTSFRAIERSFLSHIRGALDHIRVVWLKKDLVYRTREELEKPLFKHK